MTALQFYRGAALATFWAAGLATGATWGLAKARAPLVVPAATSWAPACPAGVKL